MDGNLLADCPRSLIHAGNDVRRLDLRKRVALEDQPWSIQRVGLGVMDASLLSPPSLPTIHLPNATAAL
jgi:hypothetical protein